jgi:polysaccharide pyruvyl transferase WcaK-like protein
MLYKFLAHDKQRPRESQPKIGLVGYYQQKNFGDDLLAEIFYKKLVEDTDYEVIVFDCSDDLCASLGDTDCKTWDEHARECAYVIFGGGGVLGELQKRRFGWRMFRDYCKKTRQLRAMHIPYSFVAVGAGPLRSLMSRILVKYIVSRAQMVIVRDKESYNVLHGIGIRKDKLYVGVDYALNLQRDDVPVEASKIIDDFLVGMPRPILGVNLCTFNCHDDKMKQKDIEERIRRAVFRAYENEEISSIVVIVSMENLPELAGAVRMIDGLACSKVKVYLHKNAWETCSLLDKIDMLLTMKLHLSIVAYLLKTPVFCVGYHPKIRRFFEQINKLKYYRDLSSFDADPEFLDSFLRDAHMYFDHQESADIMLEEKKQDMNRRVLATLRGVFP